MTATAAAYLSPARGSWFDVAWTAAAISALAGCLAARRSAHPDNRAHWTLWSLAAGAWLLGQLAWNLFGVIGFPPSPNVADVGWWLCALLIMASMLRVPRAPRTVGLIVVLESTPMALAVTVLCIAALWKLAAASHLPLAGRISALLYPALYISAAMMMLQAIVGGRLSSLRQRSMQLALAGMLGLALAFSLWSVQLLAGDYVPGRSPLDPIWVGALLAIGAGGMLAARHPGRPIAVQEHSDRSLLLPSATLMALLGALALASVTGAPTSSLGALRAGVAYCGLALLVRSWVLTRRMRSLLARERRALAMLEQREAELAQLNQQLADDSRRDPLTGLRNRRALADDLAALQAGGQQRPDAPIAVLLCDVDHFKRYNDRLGHLAGDRALRMIAATARGVLDGAGSVYRFGGEELLMIVPDADPARALALAERVRLAIEGAAYPHPDAEAGILTASVGVACGQGEVSALLERADAALYDAKRAGRNRISLAGVGDQEETVAPARPARQEAPAPAHLRGMLALSRVASSGDDLTPLLGTLAETIRAELGFHIVAVNVRDRELDELRVELVLGDAEAREALLGTSRSVADWQGLLSAGEQIHGAAFLREGSYSWTDGAHAWTSPAVRDQSPDAWQPEDMLLLPMRGGTGELLGVVSVDQPLLGCRPSPEEIAVLMAVVDHAAPALERALWPSERSHPEAETRLSAVMLLAETLDMRDAATARHARTVGELSRQIAVALGLEAERVGRVYAAGVLHDLGKLGVPDAILRKPGPLDEEEWSVVRRHPEIGARILELAGLEDIAGWVLSHHERIDGRGYPFGLRAEEIALESRILAVADAYEAMVTARPYRPALSCAQAHAELVRCAGTQFDARVVEAFARTQRIGSGQETALMSAA